MVRGFYAQVIDALKAAGYSFKRQGKGDHESGTIRLSASP
jgi:hypothetical protein